MSESLKSLAKKKMLEAKRKAKEEEKKAKEILKSKKMEEKQKTLRLIQEEKQGELEKKNYAKRIKTEVLDPYYKNKENTLSSQDLYIGKLEDGNIIGKNKKEYFYSYQTDDQTYIKVFTYKGKVQIDDGDHYPRFETVDVYNAKDVAINSFGNTVASSVKSDDYYSFYFGRSAQKTIDEYNRLDKLAKEIDERINKLNNTSKR